MRIVAKPALGIRRRFIDAALIAAVERDARTARVNQPAHEMPSAPFDHVSRAKGIDAVKIVPRTPDARHAGHMKDDVYALTRCGDPVGISQIGQHGFDAERIEFGDSAAAKRADPIAAGGQLFDDIQAEESPGAGDEAVHCAIVVLSERRIKCKLANSSGIVRESISLSYRI